MSDGLNNSIVHVCSLDNTSRQGRSKSRRVSIQSTGSCRRTSVKHEISCCGIANISLSFDVCIDNSVCVSFILSVCMFYQCLSRTCIQSKVMIHFPFRRFERGR